MGHTAGQLTEALQPVGLMHLALEPFALGLCAESLAFGLLLDPVGDVADGGGDQWALFGLHRRERDLGRERRPILAPGGQLHTRAHRPSHRMHDVAIAVLRMSSPERFRHQHLDSLAYQLVASVAELPLGLLVHQRDPAVRVHGHDRVGRRFEQVLEHPRGCLDLEGGQASVTGVIRTVRHLVPSRGHRVSCRSIAAGDDTGRPRRTMPAAPPFANSLVTQRLLPRHVPASAVSSPTPAREARQPLGVHHVTGESNFTPPTYD